MRRLTVPRQEAAGDIIFVDFPSASASSFSISAAFSSTERPNGSRRFRLEDDTVADQRYNLMRAFTTTGETNICLACLART